MIDGDEIVYRDYTDISIAVATSKGLVVPVLRSADELSFADVEKARFNGQGLCAQVCCGCQQLACRCSHAGNWVAVLHSNLALQDCWLSGCSLSP